MSLFQPAPPPVTPLAAHRVLSRTAGVRVSPLCLGAMNFGDAWKDYLGECNEETTYEILDHFFDAGGNFIDTSNNYQEEESEVRLGKWMQKRGNRDQIVLATKFTTPYKRVHQVPAGVASNYSGNNHKSIHLSIEASLKKLQTDYIDLLYMHWWAMDTSIEEVMQALNRFVQAGKVLYLGVSDTPAWWVAKANQYARDHGLKPFSVYQGKWSVADRDFESEILPMCIDEGMAVAPWGALGRGQFKTKEQREANDGRKMGQPSEIQLKCSEVLEKIAKKHNTIMTSIALAYVMHEAPDVYPIVGGRNVNHLKGNIDALKIRLDDEDMTELRGAWGFKPSFPMDFLFGAVQYSQKLGAGDNFLTKTVVHMPNPPKRQPILPEHQPETSNGA